MGTLKATLTIPSETKSFRYSPMIFGGFLEHFGRQIYGGVFEPGSPLSNENGFRMDVLDALRELRIPVVRWPGGCYASGYHWEDGVGRPRNPADDMAWGVVEPHTFGTDEFIELSRLVGWEPYICNNAGNGTIDEMKAWVEYCNGTTGRYARMRAENGYRQPHAVSIWSIGNENWGRHEIGQKPIDSWGPLVRAAAMEMKAADPTIKLTAAALPTREWTIPLLKQAGDYLDYVSIHRYWFSLHQENYTPSYLDCMMKSDDPEMLFAEYCDVLDESGYRGRIQIAFDEWNLRGWHHPGFPRKAVQDYDDPEVLRLVAARDKNLIASQYTMADALFSASVLNACIRHGEDVGMANIAPLVNTRGPLHVFPDGLIKRAHFHTLALYANHLEPRAAHMDVHSDRLEHNGESVSAVDAIATVDETGQRWAISITNRHPREGVECELKFDGLPVTGVVQAEVLTADSPDAYNDIETPRRVWPTTESRRIEDGRLYIGPCTLAVIRRNQ